jgi:hypothetical protein
MRGAIGLLLWCTVAFLGGLAGAALQAQTTQFVGVFNIGTLFGAGDAIEVRNATQGQAVRVYGTFTDPSNYERLTLAATSTEAVLSTERAGTGASRDLVFRDMGATRLTLGGAAPAYYVTLPSTARATLPAAPNGSLVYCTDCSATLNCNAGAGAVAKRQNSLWRCN